MCEYNLSGSMSACAVALVGFPVAFCALSLSHKFWVVIVHLYQPVKEMTMQEVKIIPAQVKHWTTDSR